MFKYIKQFSKDFTRIADSLEIIANGKLLEKDKVDEPKRETTIESASLEQIYDEEQNNLGREVASRIESEFKQQDNESVESYERRLSGAMIEDYMTEKEVEKIF